MKFKLSSIYTIMLVCSMLLMVSCYKDKGNYDLQEINSVSFVKVGSDTLKVNQFDSLKVKTELKQTMASSNDNLTYKWSVYLATPPITGVINETLADTKDLNILFGLRPDNYTLLYTVTDKNTGVSYFKKYLLQVSSTLSEGWLMVGERSAGHRDVDLLHPNGNVYKSLLSLANPGLTVPKGLHSVSVGMTFFAGSQDIYVLGDHDAWRVRYTDFAKINEAKDWFIQAPAVIKPQSYYYDKVGSNMFYVDNNKIYSNQIDFRFGAEVDLEHFVSPYLLQAQSSDAAIVYDLKRKKFLNYARKVFTGFSNPVDAAFDMNNVGMDVLFGGMAPGNQYSYLMKDNGNVPYVMRIHSGGAAGKFPVNNAPDILKASQAVFSGLYLHVYYSVDNKIYLLDVANNTASVVYSFPQGENVTAMTLKQTKSSFVGYPDNNRLLAVGTYDGATGTVYTFGIDNVGRFDGDTYKSRYLNLDKPISLEYKNRK